MILFKGLILGFLIAAPVGPIGVLCIQRTLSKGRVSGFVSGLGAATADAFYGAVAAFGLVVISNVLIEQQFILRLCGGIFLLYTGLKIFYSKPRENSRIESKTNLMTDYISTFFLTITNPITIISFTALFTGIGFMRGTFTTSGFLVAGVFLGSALWWLILSFGIKWIQFNVKNFSLELINKISGTVILIFALVVLVNR